jgi:hypothetical protein
MSAVCSYGATAQLVTADALMLRCRESDHYDRLWAPPPTNLAINVAFHVLQSR